MMAQPAKRGFGWCVKLLSAARVMLLQVTPAHGPPEAAGLKPTGPLSVLASKQEKHLVNALVNTFVKILVNVLVNASFLSSVSRQLNVRHAEDVQSRQVRKKLSGRAQSHVTARHGRGGRSTAQRGETVHTAA